MVLRVWLAAAISLLASGIATAQDTPKASYQSVVTQHTIQLNSGPLTYTAKAGLMPVRAADGTALGELSYVAYSVAPQDGERRPVAFAWNGGPGANSTLLHYGAFGPLRLDDETLGANPATLLDVADLVFVDMIETGFGRITPRLERARAINGKADVEAFTSFVETWLKDTPARPVYLIGESYGVYRAVHVATELGERDVPVDGLVLISGSTLILPQLDPITKGIALFPTLATLAFEDERLPPDAGANAAEVYRNAHAWALAVREEAKTKSDNASMKPLLVTGLRRFSGKLPAPIKSEMAITDIGVDNALTVVGLIGPDAFRLPKGDINDLRKPPDAFEQAGISPAVVADIRQSLGFSPPRPYIGQEPPERSDKTVGLVNWNAYWPLNWETKKETWPSTLLEAAPELRLFFASGMYDARFSCAHTAEGIAIDLAAYSSRVRTGCYAGGHMMYDDRAVGELLSADVREFIRADRSAP